MQDGTQDGPRQVHARPVLVSPLLKQALDDQLRDGAAGGRLAEPKRLHREGCGETRRAERLVGKGQRVAAQQRVAGVVVADQRPRLKGSPLGRPAHAVEEELQPGSPLTVRTHALQQDVVLVAMALQIGGEVQQRARQTLAVDQEQRDKQPPQAAVAADERVDGLELLVQHGALDEVGERTLVVEELVPGA